MLPCVLGCCLLVDGKVAGPARNLFHKSHCNSSDLTWSDSIRKHSETKAESSRNFTNCLSAKCPACVVQWLDHLGAVCSRA